MLQQRTKEGIENHVEEYVKYQSLKNKKLADDDLKEAEDLRKMHLANTAGEVQAIGPNEDKHPMLKEGKSAPIEAAAECGSQTDSTKSKNRQPKKTRLPWKKAVA